jgi:hypothetical protein
VAHLPSLADFDYLHYHALIFGYGFPDKKIFKKQKSGDLFPSDILPKCWGMGASKISENEQHLKNRLQANFQGHKSKL